MSKAFQRAEERLLSAIGAVRVSHAFFISSLDSEPAVRLARRAAALVCTGEADEARLAQSAGFRAYDGASMRIDDIRELIAGLAQSPLNGQMRCTLIEAAHGMSIPVQNALLKTLEEPPSSAVFILTGNIAGVLPTVASRCAVIRRGLSSASEIESLLLSRGASPAEARFYAAAGGGSETRALRLYEDETFRTLRDDSLAAIIALLRGELPLGAAKKLCANRGAADAFAFMLSFLRDLLARLTASSMAPENPDRQDAIAAFAPRFTIGRVTCMIEMLSKATGDLYSANAGALMDLAVADRLFLEISEAVTNK